jgi:hypothetical protein
MKAISAEVRPKIDGTRKIRSPKVQTFLAIKSDGKEVKFDLDETGAAVVDMKAGKTYQLKF